VCFDCINVEICFCGKEMVVCCVDVANVCVFKMVDVGRIGNTDCEGGS